MKTVVVFAALVALALGATVPEIERIKTKPVDEAYVDRQRKFLSLFFYTEDVDTHPEYYEVAKDYDIEANIENYTNKTAVEDFLYMYRSGFMPKFYTFSIFYGKQREEAIALFKLFYYAKDLDTFFKTAAWARINLNAEMFLYTYYIAIIQRKDTAEFILPAPYEVYPELFTNKVEEYKMFRTKQQKSITKLASEYGIVKEGRDYVYYANYSNSLTYPNNEQRLSYFTEDIGLNSFYFYFHVHLPFWMNSKKYGTLSERRGEVYFYFYQQILARYYLERLSNGLGEIPSFSWYSPITVGYYPMMTTWKYPFAQRSNHYLVHNEKNYEEVRFLDIFEKTFFQYLQNGHFKAFEQNVNFNTPEAMNFVGNYWQTNADLFGEEFTENYQRSYEMTARRVLGAAPEPFDEYNFMPSALDFYQTSLRDPAFYQLYNKIFDYMVQYKEFLTPYTQEDLHFVGVKINDVKVDKLTTFFELYDFNAFNMVKYSDPKFHEEFKVRQPRLNHKAFTVTIDVKSDVATDAAFKIWIGPKYDSNGYPITIEKNWMNFFELDLFTHKLVPGVNKIERSSEDFFWFKPDALSIADVADLLMDKKVPVEMSKEFDSMPDRLMLPKGTKGGIPYQIFVYVYKFNSVSKDSTDKYENLSKMLDEKPFGYPFDRPAQHQYFNQPNMFFEDVFIYHEGEEHPYKYVNPAYKPKEM